MFKIAIIGNVIVAIILFISVADILPASSILLHINSYFVAYSLATMLIDIVIVVLRKRCKYILAVLSMILILLTVDSDGGKFASDKLWLNIYRHGNNAICGGINCGVLDDTHLSDSVCDAPPQYVPYSADLCVVLSRNWMTWNEYCSVVILARNKLTQGIKMDKIFKKFLEYERNEDLGMRIDYYLIGDSSAMLYKSCGTKSIMP